ncbi:MAG: hypothetical protein ACREUP_08715, partial [Burkholderiales bacterium]
DEQRLCPMIDAQLFEADSANMRRETWDRQATRIRAHTHAPGQCIAACSEKFPYGRAYLLFR